MPGTLRSNHICNMDNEVLENLLIKKYNQAVPRYTSYPTVPFWKNEFSAAEWQKSFSARFHTCNAASGISIYIHLPFCQSLCTYCGCNKKITANHAVEEQYLEAIGEEWNLYRRLMHEMPVIREIHLGGGTPTFFSPKNLKRLIEIIKTNSVIHPYYEFSIEGHPNNTTKQHLATLFALGFRRISFGVQDLDPDVQRIINRIQPFENVEQVTELARTAGFRSINFDLIYGLPLQTIQGIEKTIKQVISLKPDRIAFYSYAHVPWTSRGQRLFDESNLPAAEEKIQLYIKGREILMANGYRDIGMDHFSLETDGLYKAKQDGSLNRNFMGYTTQNTGLLLGLGVSAISDLGNAYAQNDKTLHNYYESIHEKNLAVKRGIFLTDEDRAFGRYIRDISCKGQTKFDPRHLALLEEFCLPALEKLADDGLIEFDKTFLKLTAKGHYFIRNVCSCLDLYLQRNRSLSAPQTFSKAI